MSSYRAGEWPPAAAPDIAGHLLTAADVPAGLSPVPVTYPSNGPSVDWFAVGFPGPAAEADFARPADQSFPQNSGIIEILGRASSAQAAADTFDFARDHLYGDCERYWGQTVAFPQMALPQSGPDLVAYEISSGGSYWSGAGVVVLGWKGDFAFDLQVNHSTGYPNTQTATMPTVGEVAAVVDAALSQLPAGGGAG